MLAIGNLVATDGSDRKRRWIGRADAGDRWRRCYGTRPLRSVAAEVRNAAGPLRSGGGAGGDPIGGRARRPTAVPLWGRMEVRPMADKRRRITAATRAAEVERIARRIRRRAERAADARPWYADARRVAAERVGPDGAALWLSMFAATSPRASLPANVRHADRAYRLAASGRDTDEGAPYGLAAATSANVRRAARGEALRGPKVGPFAAALGGDPDAVAVDVWILRAAYGADIAATAARSAVVAAAVRVAARRLGWSPAETQAAAWTAERDASGRGIGSASLADVVGRIPYR